MAKIDTAVATMSVPETANPEKSITPDGFVPYERRAMRFSWGEKIRWLGSFWLRFPFVLAGLIIFTVVHAGVVVVQPILIRNIFDTLRAGPTSLARYDDPVTRALYERGVDTVSELAWAFLAFAVLAFAIYIVLQNARAWMNCRLEMTFRQRVFEDISHYGPRFSGAFSVGDIVTRLTDDVAEKLSWFACSGIFRFYEAVILVCLGVSVMYSLNATLTLYVMAPLPVLIVLFRLASSRLDRRYDFLQSRISRVYDVMEACFSGIRVVKAYCQEDAQKVRFAQAVNHRREAEIATVRAQTLVDSFYMYVWEFGLILALLAGGYMVIHDQITLGEYLAFDFFVALMIMPMLDIGQFLVKGMQSAVSSDRLMELQSWRTTRAPSGSRELKLVTRELRFESVALSLDGVRPVLTGVTFAVAPGETVALVGKVGSGKSWTLNMIPRLVDPDTGRISIDGVDLREYNLEDLRRLVGFVSQEPALFSDTLESNIRFGRNWVSDTDLARSIELSQLTEDVAKFPDGVTTNIGNRGVQLSGGQKQRVALARALAGRPQVLLLDDCTSALDAVTEEKLWAALSRSKQKIIRLVVTHRTSALKSADRILVFHSGQVVESGTHAELIHKGELYREIYHRRELEEAV